MKTCISRMVKFIIHLWQTCKYMHVCIEQRAYLEACLLAKFKNMIAADTQSTLNESSSVDEIQSSVKKEDPNGVKRDN